MTYDPWWNKIPEPPQEEEPIAAPMPNRGGSDDTGGYTPAPSGGSGGPGDRPMRQIGESISRWTQEMMQRSADIEAKLRAQRGEMPAVARPRDERPAEEERLPGRIKSLQEELAKQALMASERKPVPKLTPEASETQVDLEKMRSAFGQAGQQGYGWGSRLQGAIGNIAPAPIDESGMVTYEHEQALRRMKEGTEHSMRPGLNALLGHAVDKLGPAGDMDEWRRYGEAMRGWQDDPTKQAVLDALQDFKVPQVPPEQMSAALQAEFERLGLTGPAKLDALSEVMDVLEGVNGLTERLWYYVKDLSTHDFAPALGDYDTKGFYEQNGATFFAEDLKNLVGKDFQWIYFHPRAAGIDERGKTVHTSTDMIARAIDPDYARYAETMDLLGRPEVMPDMKGESLAAFFRGLGNVKSRLHGAGDWASGSTWTKPLQWILRGLEVGTDVLAGAIGVLAVLDEIPADVYGLIRAMVKKVWPGGDELREEKELLATGTQLMSDITAPLPVKIDPTGKTGLSWGAEHMDIPQGAYNLPPELQEFGFKWSSNPWLDMVLKEVISLQWFIPSFTQAGALRKTGIMDKLANLSPEFASAIKAGDMAGAWRAFKSSGLESSILSEATDMAKRGGSIDWVQPQAKIFAKADDYRQFNKLLANSLPAASADPDFYRDVLKAWERIGEISDEAARTQEWAKYLTRMIAERGAIGTKPGVLARFPTKHPKMYEALTPEKGQGPAHALYAGMHVAPRNIVKLDTPEATAALYGHYVNMGASRRRAEAFVDELRKIPIEDRGLYMMEYEDFLNGKRLFGLNAHHDFSYMADHLWLNEPVIDPANQKILLKELEGLIPDEVALRDKIVGTVFKTLDDQGMSAGEIMDTFRDINKGTANKNYDDILKRYVKYAEDTGAISADEAAILYDRIKGLNKTRLDFIERARGKAGKLERMRFAPKKAESDFQTMLRDYGMIEVTDPDTGKTIQIHAENPLTTKQLSNLHKFKHDPVMEMWKYDMDELGELLKTKAAVNRGVKEVNTALNSLSMKWKKWFIYPRPRYVVKTYLSGQFKSLLTGTISPSDVRKYKELMENGMTVLDDGTPIKASNEALNVMDDFQGKTMTGEAGHWKREYTGSWLVGDSRDDPAQAIQNFLNQFADDPGVIRLLKEGDDSFLKWLDETPEGQKMLRTWKPITIGTGDTDDVAQNYMAFLKELMAQTEDSAPGAYKAMLYYSGILDDPSELPAFFQKSLRKRQAKLDKAREAYARKFEKAKQELTDYIIQEDELDMLDKVDDMVLKRLGPEPPELANITVGEMAAYLSKQGVGGEHFFVPMVRRPHGVMAKARAGGKSAMSWVDADAGDLYRKAFTGVNVPRQHMYRSLTMDYASQLIKKGVDPDMALKAGAAEASRTVSDLLLDFTRKTVLERELDWLSPFLCAFRLDAEAWGRMVASRPWLAKSVAKYYNTASDENGNLPGYMRWDIPIKIGGGVYNLNVPLILLAPWAYSMPQGDNIGKDIARGFMGPIPRGVMAEVEAIAPNRRMREIEAKVANPDLSESERQELGREYEYLKSTTGGFLEEMEGATLGYPEAFNRGAIKGTLRNKINAVPEQYREHGWTDAILQSLDEDDEGYMRYLMNQYIGNKKEKNEPVNSDEAFMWAYEQLPGSGWGGWFTSGATSALGAWARGPWTYKPEVIQENYDLEAQARQEGRWLQTSTPFKPGTTERMTPFEWEQEQIKRDVTSDIRGAQTAWNMPFNIAMTAMPERYQEIAAARGEQVPDLGGWSDEESRETQRFRDAAAESVAKGGAPLGLFGMGERPLEPALTGMGYTPEGKMTEALEFYRDYQDKKSPGETWAEYLANRAEDEAPYDAARQQQILSYVNFYPYGGGQYPGASDFWYGQYQEKVMQPYWDLIGEISRLTDLKNGEGQTDMSKAEIVAALEDARARLVEFIKWAEEQGIQIPNLEMEVDLNKLLSPYITARRLMGHPVEGKYPTFNVTTEQLRQQAGMTPVEETRMPSPPEAEVMRKFPKEKDRQRYIQAMVTLTSTPTTYGKSTVPVDMETAMYISGMNVDEIKKNRGKKGLGSPFYDSETGQVYISPFPIDWLDQPTQDLIRANVDDATWEKIMANAAGQQSGGGGGYRRYGGGYRGWRSYGGGGGKGFKITRGAGPLTPEGLSKTDIFFTLPKSQRTAYLDANPDLKAYFRRQKEGESDQDYAERMKLMDMADRYFHILDPAARRGFIRDHPELVAYFETLRQKKDLYFMRAMARAFANNPDLWEIYLQKQNELTDALIAQMGKMSQRSETKVARRKKS